MSKGAKGNTQGRVVGEQGSTPGPAAAANPTVKPETVAEASTGNQVLDGLQTGLDVAGLIPGVGEIADLANAGISALRGDWVGAGLSLASAIPFAGWGATAAKAGRKVAKASGEAGAKAAKEAAERAAKEAAEKAEKEAAEKAAKEKGGKVKPKKKMKCGESGKYGDLKKKTGDGKFDRDHIPSKAALKARAEQLQGDPLSAAQKRAIDNAGNAIAIPRQAHIDVSPTHGQSLSDAAKDAGDLAGSAKRDVNAMLEKIDEHDEDGGCRKAYQTAAKTILQKTNADFDKMLADILRVTK